MTDHEELYDYEFELTGTITAKDLGFLFQGIEKAAMEAQMVGATDESKRIQALQPMLAYNNPEAFVALIRHSDPEPVHSEVPMDPLSNFGFRDADRREEIRGAVEDLGFELPELPEEIIEQCRASEIDIEDDE